MSLSLKYPEVVQKMDYRGQEERAFHFNRESGSWSHLSEIFHINSVPVAILSSPVSCTQDLKFLIPLIFSEKDKVKFHISLQSSFASVVKYRDES